MVLIDLAIVFVCWCLLV